MFIVSFPRSGQHLIERLLKHIYNYYGKEYGYCEFYSCCGTTPCKKKSLFQKNHDFGLNLELKSDEKFLVLYREDKIHQLESFFRFDAFFHMDKFNSIVNYDDEIIFNRLIDYIKLKSDYYDGFINKYIKSKQYKDSFLIEYSHFLSNPKQYIKQIILFLNLTNSETLDLDSENIVHSFEKIEYKNSLDNAIYKKINARLQLEI